MCIYRVAYSVFACLYSSTTRGNNSEFCWKVFEDNFYSSSARFSHPSPLVWGLFICLFGFFLCHPLSLDFGSLVTCFRFDVFQVCSVVVVVANTITLPIIVAFSEYWSIQSVGSETHTNVKMCLRKLEGLWICVAANNLFTHPYRNCNEMNVIVWLLGQAKYGRAPSSYRSLCWYWCVTVFLQADRNLCGTHSINLLSYERSCRESLEKRRSNIIQ